MYSKYFYFYYYLLHPRREENTFYKNTHYNIEMQYRNNNEIEVNY